MGHTFLKHLSGRLSTQGSNYTRLSRSPPQIIGSDITCWENPRERILRRSNKNEIEPDLNKGMTLPSTQNLKTLALWVFFLICCSIFSFLLNVGLRLILGYPTILVRRIRRRQYWEDQTRIRQEFDPHKRMTPPSTKNLKALSLWVNVRLRLTL